MLVLFALACSKDTSTPDGLGSTTTPAPDPDPDVNSYWPDTFPPTSVARIVYFGDSITRGFGIDNPDNTYTKLLVHNNDSKWPDFAGDDLTARYGDLEVVDVSQDGATTDSVIASQLDEVDAAVADDHAGPTLIVGTIGGNDMLNAIFTPDVDAAVDQLLANMQQITDFFLDPARFPDGAYLAIANVYEPSDGTGQVDECFYGLDLSALQPELDKANQGTLDQAKQDGWAWVDLYGQFLAHGFRADEDGPWADPDDPTLWFQDDCIHPNVRGHHEVRRLFLSAIDGEPLPLLPPPE